MNNPIIFLDFDGVLNSRSYYNSDRYPKIIGDSNITITLEDIVSRSAAKAILPEFERDPIEFYRNDIDPIAVGIFNTIFDHVTPGIVVSSTWRNGHSIAWLQAVFNVVGLKGIVIGKTPSLAFPGAVRGNEIREYTQGNRITNFVIIDDDSDMLYEHRNRFVNTDNTVGISAADVLKVVQILKGLL